MKRIDLYLITVLAGIVLLIFYPVFYTDYVYTDEAVQLWHYRPNAGYTMFAGQGRYITEKLFQWLFSSIHTIQEIRYVRLFSLLGWVACLPVWYFLIRKVVMKENLSAFIPFIAGVYIVTMPAFLIYAGWASVLEVFIACTGGLISGYALYSGIDETGHKLRLNPGKCLLSVFFGCISLFTYQNGFGCFLLPFVMHLIAKRVVSRKLLSSVAGYFFIYAVYYFLFKASLAILDMQASSRTGLHINVGNKLPFFLARPMSSAFHFTWLFNERSVAGFTVYGLVAGTWFLFSFFQLKNLSVLKRVKYFAALFCLLGLIYLPSLVVKENYSSNRTLFALNLAVFFIVIQLLLVAIKNDRTKFAIVTGLSILFVINAWYNFNKQFLQPVANEYMQVRKFIEANYHAGTDTVYFIRPREDFFVKKYGITRSWDEFGVPSTFFEWTPEFLTRQIIFEKTGSRKTAENLFIRSWPGEEDIYFKSLDTPVSKNILLVHTEAILNAGEQGNLIER